jgi:hypothetical protein
VVELVLQRAGAGGDDGAQPGQQHRHQIGEGLAGAGTGLGQQQVALLQRIGDGFGQVQLCRTRDEGIQVRGERAAVAEGFAAGMDKVGHQREEDTRPGAARHPFQARAQAKATAVFMALGCTEGWRGGLQDTP